MDQDRAGTHTASSKFFAAMALLPRAFSSSAVDMVGDATVVVE